MLKFPGFSASAMRSRCLLLSALLCVSGRGVWCQRVRVEPEVTAYPNSSANLRCEFTSSGTTKLTQVSWMFERVEGDRQNIAVFHPQYGASYPNQEFLGRVAFTVGSLENPSIRISALRMSDAGRYICEFATYPSGNEQGTSTLTMLAKPRNSASAVPVAVGVSEVVVARCEAAQGKPEATISWITSLAGRYNHTSVPESDGTVTVRSEFRIVPTPAENQQDVMCVVNQRTQSEPRSFPLKLVVQYPPTVRIEGYDSNWYVGRTDAALVCQADSNPAPTAVSWSAASGPLPASVRVDQNRLLVQKVDESVNTTFVCEVKNSLGSGRMELAALVIESTEEASSAGVVAGGVLGSLLAVSLVGALVVVLVARGRRHEGEQVGYGNKTRLFGVKKSSDGGHAYSYRENQPGALPEHCSRLPRLTAPAAGTTHDDLLDGAERRKFEALNDSEEEEEEGRYECFSGPPPGYQHHPGYQYPDDMESQRDGSIISRTAIYV